MARPGRKRKSGNRTPSGQLSRAGCVRDMGTPETLMRREWWAQKEDGKLGDIAMTSYPLGVLYTNDSIGQGEWRAGCRYAWLHARCYGRKSVAAVKWDDAPRGSGDDETAEHAKWIAERKIELSRATAALDARERRLLDNLCIHERTPRWMMPLMPRPSDVTEAMLVKSGLAKLEAHFGYGRASRAAA